MEIFNGELNKLVARQDVVVKLKDYSIIMNTVVHMLEEKNMLVFLEGIKTVELLALILKTALVKT